MTYAKRSRLAPAFAALCLLIAGCGQKGPLYLPGDRSETETEIPLPGQSEDEEAQQDDDDPVDHPR
jgi:predicted small lipoprotein YifL